MSINESPCVGAGSKSPFDVLAKFSGTQPSSPWTTLAVSTVRQALRDAVEGNYDALLWLVDEGRAWLAAAGVPIDVVDSWGAKL